MQVVRLAVDEERVKEIESDLRRTLPEAEVVEVLEVEIKGMKVKCLERWRERQEELGKGTEQAEGGGAEGRGRKNA